MIEGSIVALITPFKNGKIDWEQLERLIEFHIENGTHGILTMGTTGESATHTHDEHNEVNRFVVKKANHRIKVIAGTGSNSTKEALELAKEAEQAGADAHLSIVPYYNKPTQKGLFVHFKTIADSVKLPMIVYNVPGRTGVNLLPQTVARLAEIPNIIGIKEASGDVRQCQEILELTGTDFALFSGDDFINYPLLAIGGKGFISVTANIVPRKLADIYNKWVTGDPEQQMEARKLHYSLLPLHRAMFLETNPIPVKTAAKLMGLIDTLEFRSPLAPMSDENLTKLEQTLQLQGLIK